MAKKTTKPASRKPAPKNKTASAVDVVLSDPDAHSDFEHECAFLKRYGYLETLATGSTDKTFVRALARYQGFDGNVERFKRETCCPFVPDGKSGPSTRLAMRVPRCGMPDVGPQVEAAIGRGGWKGCLGNPDEHGVIIQVQSSNMPAHWAKSLNQILAIIQRANAKYGLLIRFVDPNGKDILTGDDLSQYNVNTTVSWVRGRGWIGLALVGGVQSCSSKLWIKIDTGYGRNFDLQSQIWQTAVLLAHEFGHNMSFQHRSTRSGDKQLSIMNPGIQRWKVEPTWTGGRHQSDMERLWGGEPVDIPGADPPVPPIPPVPPNGGIKALSFPFRMMDGQSAIIVTTAGE